MLGWRIIIYKKDGSGSVADRQTLASWLVGLGGTDWLDQMVTEGKATLLGFNGGYPIKYSTTLQDLRPRLATQPESYEGPVVIGEDYIMPSGWRDSMTHNSEVLSTCRPDEELIIDAWDQS